MLEKPEIGDCSAYDTRRPVGHPTTTRCPSRVVCSPAATSSMSCFFSAAVSEMMLSSNVTRTELSSGRFSRRYHSVASSARQMPAAAPSRACSWRHVPHERRVVRRHLRGRLHVPNVSEVEVIDAEPAEVAERLQGHPERACLPVFDFRHHRVVAEVHRLDRVHRVREHRLPVRVHVHARVVYSGPRY